jgi:MFS family permease
LSLNRTGFVLMARSITVNTPVANRVGTFAALQSSNFRLYFIGQLLSMSGTWMQNVAQGFLVFQLTKSEFWLGIVACAAGLPLLLLSPFAGVIVERMPRRRLMLITQVIQMMLAFILAALVFTNAVQIWHIVVLATLLGITNAFDAPARQTFIVDLIGKDLLPSGIAMNSIIVNGSRVLGPTVAGIFLATFGAAWCFLLNGLSFLCVIGTLFALHLDSESRPKQKTRALAQLREGLRYVRSHPVVMPLILLSGAGGFLCWATISLFPAFSDVVLHAPEEGLAIISAANGVGAVLAGLVISYLGQKYGRGRILTTIGLMTGIFIALMSRTTTLPLAALMSAGFGFCAISFFVTINTSIQLTIPNEFRGRVLSIYTWSIIGLNPFGALLLAFLAEEIGNPDALAIYGGLLWLVCAAVLVKFPQVRRIV